MGSILTPDPRSLYHEQSCGGLDGRLVRRATDSGVFVMLDPMMPSRLSGAFPDGVEIERVGLADAVGLTRDFLSQPE